MSDKYIARSTVTYEGEIEHFCLRTEYYLCEEKFTIQRVITKKEIELALGAMEHWECIFDEMKDALLKVIEQSWDENGYFKNPLPNSHPEEATENE